MAAQSARPFIFALHCHQPAGNRPEVMTEAYTRCYEPIVEAIQRFPEVKVCLHVSGALLEHAVHHRKSFVQGLRQRVEGGQVELLGGGFYEPILSALPDADAQGQLEMMSQLLNKHFGARPKGAWLTERVWEPELPRLLAPAGLGFTFIDDPHLKASLPDEVSADGYWVTDRAGKMVALFGVQRSLRYRLPSEDPESVVRGLPELPGTDLLTFADDGEKFGLWPGSYEWVHQGGWLARFFEALTQAQAAGRVQTVLPSQHLESVPPRGRVHVPSGSYEELSRWALGPNAAARLARVEAAIGPDEADRAHLRGGSWADFLIRYPEAGRLQGRMISVSQRLEAVLGQAMSHHRGRALPSMLQDRLGTAQRDLYRAQGADPYWHGLFAGVHVPFLRADAHQALIRADALLDRVQQGDEQWVAFEERDLDLDGELEVMLSNRAVGAHIKAHEGGALIGLEDKVRALSLADVLAHRPEPEHVDAPADRLDPYDAGPRWAFLDRFTAGPQGEGPDVGDLSRARYRVQALDVDEGEEVAARLALQCEGRVAGSGLIVDKTYSLDLEGAHLSVNYLLQSKGDGGQTVHFAPQLSLALSEACQLRVDGAEVWVGLQGLHRVAGQVVLQDTQAGLRITLDLSVPVQLRAHPVHTTVRTLGGFERIFQGWSLDLVHTLALPAGEPQRVQIGLDLSEAVP